MKSFYRYLIPSVAATVFMSAYAIIDGIFIGQKIGDVGLSAINIAWPITALLQCIGAALGLSGGIYISSLKGSGMEEKSRRMKLTTVLILLAVSVVLGSILYFLSHPILRLFGARDLCLTYAREYISVILTGSAFQVLGVGLIPLLKNSGKVKYAMLGSVVSIFVNLILDYLLIYIFDMGLIGAALASVLAQAVSFAVCFIPYIHEFKGVCFARESMRALWLGASAPFILNFSYSFIIIITNALCLNYGGNEAVAAYTLLSYLLYVIGAIGTGTADSIQPLFSFHHAQKDYRTNYDMLKKCLMISFILCLIASALFLVLEKPLEKLYNLSGTAAQYYKEALPYYLSGFLFVSLIRVICSYLYSVNDKRRANLLTLSEPLCLTPLLYLLLCPFLKLLGVWLGFLLIQLILFSISVILLTGNIKKQKEYLWKGEQC